MMNITIMHHRSDAPQEPEKPSTPAAPSQPNSVRAQLARTADTFLRGQMLWVTLATALVYLSHILNMTSAVGWVGLALACLPIILRLVRSGVRAVRTPFDLPIVLLLGGGVVGFCVSDDRTISLGALQCMFAMTLFYYCWVNSSRLANVIKWFMISLALVFLVACIFYAVVVSIIEGQPNLDILGSGTHHGFAMYLTIEGAILLGIAGFDRDKRTRLLSFALFLIFLVIVVMWTSDSLNSLVGGVSLSGRWPIWEKTTDLLSESPLTGLGLGCWALTYWGTTILDTPTVGGITHAHNAYLELYSNTGIVGVLALLAALVIGLRLSLNIIRCPRTHPSYGFGVGMIIACFVSLLVGIVESAPMGVPLVAADTYYYVVSPAVWMLCGLLVMAHRNTTNTPGDQRDDPQQIR